VGQKIRAETQEVRVMGLVVPIFCDFPNLVERGGIHAAQTAKMFYELLP
jgi:hypothetical protein